MSSRSRRDNNKHSSDANKGTPGDQPPYAPPPREWKLEPETEYRFELDAGTTLGIKLVRGQAEIFGAELVEGRLHLFYEECKAAVYTWQGCTIEHVTGRPSTEYISEETAMTPYANVHLAFEAMRVRALHHAKITAYPDTATPEDLANQRDGAPQAPRVLILGPENSGKTTVTKTLLNYATRAGQDWCPMLVNVDPGEGGPMLPGALSATPIQTPIHTSTPALVFGSSATTAPSHISTNALLPFGYWYGHSETKRNPLLLDRLIRNLGENVWDRWDNDPRGKASGLIVDTPSSLAASSGGGNEHRLALIKACVDAFRINVILVVGHEKLNVEMQRAYGGDVIKVVKIPKSGGVVELDAQYRARIHKYQMHAYFYGQRIAPPLGYPPISSTTGSTMYLIAGEQAADLSLSPSSIVTSFVDLTIWRIGEETMAPSSALPIGATRAVSEMQPLLVDPSQPGSGLYNAVLAIIAPPNPDESERYDEEILDLNIVGFIIITSLDIPNKRMTILTPSHGSLAGKTAIVGSYQWQEL